MKEVEILAPLSRPQEDLLSDALDDQTATGGETNELPTDVSKDPDIQESVQDQESPKESRMEKFFPILTGNTLGSHEEINRCLITNGLTEVTSSEDLENGWEIIDASEAPEHKNLEVHSCVTP